MYILLLRFLFLRLSKTRYALLLQLCVLYVYVYIVHCPVCITYEYVGSVESVLPHSSCDFFCVFADLPRLQHSL